MNEVDRLAARLPIFGRVRLYLEQRAAAGDEQAEDLLAEVDTLLIEHAHEEAITEGIITRVGNAWIV